MVAERPCSFRQPSGTGTKVDCKRTRLPQLNPLQGCNVDSRFKKLEAGPFEVPLMQHEEGLFLSIVKSIMSFRRGEVQWDAGVCHSSVSQECSSRFRFSELARAAASTCVALM